MAKGAVLVTGGAVRIGAQICCQLAQCGYEPIIHANNSLEAAQDLQHQIRAQGQKANLIIGDLSDDAFVADLINQAHAIAQSPLLGLINNASVFEPDLAIDFSSEGWDKHFKINALVPCKLAQDFANTLGNGKSGAIINILDQRIFRPNPLFFTYNLSKNTLAAATKTMAQSFAPNIRVNAIAPGPTLMNSRQAPSDFAGQTEATLLQTGSPPQAIAETVVFLLEAKHITGQILAVDSGQSLIWQTPDIEGINE